MPTINQLIEAAKLMRSGDGENREYDRALVELIGEFLPGMGEEKYPYLYRIVLDQEWDDSPPRVEEPLTHVEAFQDLARRLASALNYSYEATMNDYSMTSINRAAVNLMEVRRTVTRLGLIESNLVTRNEHGVWVPIRKEN